MQLTTARIGNWRHALQIVLLPALFCLLQPTSHATSVLPMSLNEIIDNAPVVFHGICTSNRTERDPVTNFIVTYTSFDVRDALKGDVKATHTIKQIGGTLPGGEQSYQAQGIPTFVVGQEYVVYLAGVSSAGFSSPIGLSQGRFTVEQGDTGKLASNGSTLRSAAEISADGANARAVPARKLALDELKRVTRARSATLVNKP